VGGDPLIDITEVKGSIGTASPRTIKKVELPGEGEVLMFLGTDKQLYSFNGYEVTPVSDTIQIDNGESAIYMNNINEAYFNTCHAQNYSDKHWYVLFACISGATTPDYAIVYDYFAKSFWPFDNQNFGASVIADNGSGNQRRLYTQGPGHAYIWDYGTQDVATNIAASWISAKIQGRKQPVLKKINTAEINMKATSSNDVGFLYRPDWESSWTGVGLNTANNFHNVDIPRVENMVQFQFTESANSTAFEIYKIDLLKKDLGVGQ
jgi:hypothetical protein